MLGLRLALPIYVIISQVAKPEGSTSLIPKSAIGHDHEQV